MKKKLVGIFIMTLLIGTTLTSVGMNNVTIDEKDDLKSFENNEIRYQKIDPSVINRNGIFNPPVMNIDIISREENPTLVQYTGDLPAYFNWKDHEGKDWTTPVKSQGGCGSCWAFGALGALESMINIREGIADLDPDLSEQYILSCLPAAGDCSGSWSINAFRYIMDNESDGNYVNGIIPESFFPYYADDSIPCSDKSLNWEDYLIPVQDFGMIGIMTETIKTKIMEHGPLAAPVMANENFTVWGYTNHESEDYFPYERQRDINHCVLIVGWKDDPTLEKGGYWVCKNSWGPNFGYEGFFNIEYESLGIQRYSLDWVEYDPESYDWHPVPKINGPYYGLVNEPIEFQGDAAGEFPPFTWSWDLGDDTTSNEQHPTHTYSTPGDYSVVLTVTDDHGLSMTETTNVWIQETNQPPLPPSITGPSEVKTGEYCWYNFTFSDPDGTPLYLYVVAFGFESNIYWGPYPPEWQKEFINWTWEETGDYIVKAKVKDPYGAESDWATLEVTVPKSIERFTGNPLILQLFERFPILRCLLDL
jgi:PKD repeat protein